jgi:hypothetical protein
MKVGMPACGKRNTVLPGEVGTEEAEFAGARDVDDIRLEVAQLSGDLRPMTPKEGIEVEVFLQADGDGRTAEIEGPAIASTGGEAAYGRGIGDGSDAEEGKAVPLRVSGEVAAGVGDAVDLVEGIGKVGDAGWVHGG